MAHSSPGAGLGGREGDWSRLAPVRADAAVAPLSAGGAAWLGRAAGDVAAGLALQDRLFLGYFGALALLVLVSAPSRAALPCAVLGAAGLLLVATAYAARRASVPRAWYTHAYRATLLGASIGSYLVLLLVSPRVRTDAVDGALAALDARLFPVAPAVWLERFNRRPIVEWLSLFYMGFHALNGAWAVAVLWRLRAGRAAHEYLVGTAFLYAVAQLTYLAVPAAGPAVHLATRFSAPLDGGFFWGIVSGSLGAASVVRDCFPSVHTACSIWLTLFALRQARAARAPRWPIAAALTAFAAAQIVAATLVLRWHWGVDVLAGAALAVVTAWIAPKLAAWETSWRPQAAATCAGERAAAAMVASGNARRRGE